jgi:hypothetical protein
MPSHWLEFPEPVLQVEFTFDTFEGYPEKAENVVERFV